MTSDEILKRISDASGASVQSLILFCRNNMIAYTNLNDFYINQNRLPSVTECAKIRKSGSSYIKTLN